MFNDPVLMLPPYSTQTAILLDNSLPALSTGLERIFDVKCAQLRGILIGNVYGVLAGACGIINSVVLFNANI
jgi:hypothetical protein